MIRTRVLIRRERSTDGRAIAQATSVVTTASSEPVSSDCTASERGIPDEQPDSAVEANQTVEVYTSTDHSHSHSRSSSRCSSSSSHNSSRRA